MPRKSGGPQTPEGKERSSRNALTHGLSAKQVLILPDETREEYEETRQGWWEEFTPEDYSEKRLVEQVVLNDWLLKRANRRLLEAEAADPELQDLHRIELMQRYKTTNERALV